MRQMYTEVHIGYLRKISEGRYNDEIREMFNNKFNLNATTSSISSLKAKYNIQSNVVKTKTQYTKEMEDYLKEIAPTRSNKEVMEMFNEKFNETKTDRAIRGIKNKLSITTEYKKTWGKGNVPWNKGKKGYMAPNITSFKKGNKPANWVPIGSERITKDGYIQIKIQDGKFQQNWRGKHILVWEEKNGKLPKGNAVIFGDGDNRNFDINNLISVSRRQLLLLNRNNLIQNDADLTRTGVIIADIYQKISSIKKNKE